MTLRWLPLALRDLVHIKEYYTDVASLKVAAGQITKITKAARLLQAQPYMGHISQNDTDADVLEWLIPSTRYTLPYRINGNEIEILRVFDQRKMRPSSWV
jgi:plasmid stabilization system protein ParE